MYLTKQLITGLTGPLSGTIKVYFCNRESNLLFTVKEIDEHVGNGLQVVSSALAFPHVGINRHIPEIIVIDIYVLIVHRNGGGRY